MEFINRRLMWHGMFLFLIGLLTGFAETHFINTRMGLAAHLEGVMNGIFLLALGAVWNEVRVTPRTKDIGYWVALFGTYGVCNNHGCSFWHCRAFSDHRGRPSWTALAGNRCNAWVSFCWSDYYRHLSACPLGASSQSIVLNPLHALVCQPHL